MNSYNKTALSIAGGISTVGALIGLFGWWLTHKYLFVNIGFIIIGLQSIYFSHDLAMERVVKFKLNYKFARGAYIFVGLVFILANIVWLMKGFN
jgi:hypothetical protein